jgi:hypothetical protein
LFYGNAINKYKQYLSGSKSDGLPPIQRFFTVTSLTYDDP